VCSLILRKIRKVGATRYQILRLKCTKFVFRWVPPCTDPVEGAYSAPQIPQLVLNILMGLFLRGGRGRKRRGKRG